MARKIKRKGQRKGTIRRKEKVTSSVKNTVKGEDEKKEKEPPKDT